MENKIDRLYLCDGEACPKEKRSTCIYDRLDQYVSLPSGLTNDVCEHTSKPEHSITRKLGSSLAADGFTPMFIIYEAMPNARFEILDQSCVSYSIPKISTWTTGTNL